MRITISIHFNENVCFITFFKVGSRSTGAVFEKFKNQENIVRAELVVNEYFNPVDDDISFLGNQITDSNKRLVIEELKSITSNTTKKDVYILYREPVKRLLTGMVEEFSLLFENHFENKVNPLIKMVLDYMHDRVEYTDVLRRKQFFVINPHYSTLTIPEKKFYKQVFFNFILLMSKNTLNTVHTCHYMIPLVLLFETNENIKNSNNIFLINLDSGDRTKLKKTIIKYGDFEDDDTPSIETSNSLFVDDIKEMIWEPGASWDRTNLINSISRYLLYEKMAYQRLIKNTKNI